LVVGTGSIGLRHARLLAERTDVAVEVCDTRPDGLAEAARAVPGARAWSSYEAALASRPDIVVIATPPAAHAPMTRAALAAGAHVFCEKPVSDTLAGARDMAESAGRVIGRLVNIGFVQRFMPELCRIRDQIRAGIIGQVCFARYSVGSLATLEFSRSRHQRDVFGAAALDYAYGFDTFWWILRQQPAGVYARGADAPGLPLGSRPNVIAAVADYMAPLVAEVHIDYVARPELGSYFFQGDLGYLEFDTLRHVVRHGDRSSGQTSEESFAYERDEIMRLQRDHFLEAAAGKHGVHTPVEDALPGAAAVDALIRSLRSGQREAL
jgi:predicted dehydrogenase